MVLSKYEKETIILYNQAEAIAEVYTHDPKLLKKLSRMAEKYPDQVSRKNEHSYILPKRCISVHEPYSEQRRAAARERAIIGGFTPPKRGTVSKK